MWFLPLSLSQIFTGWFVFVVLAFLLLCVLIVVSYRFFAVGIRPFESPNHRGGFIYIFLRIYDNIVCNQNGFESVE
jgi:hypothetical protein